LGAKPHFPTIKGYEKKRPIYFSEIMSGEVSVGKKVVVIGGGYIGCEIADLLSFQGKEVYLKTSRSEPANDLFYPYAVLMRERLKANGVKFFSNVVENEIEEEGLRIKDSNGKRTLIEVDDIVLCTGFESDKTLSAAVKNVIPDIYEIGDYVKPRRIHEAIFEGTNAGLEV
jgi:pyruvate/2-oxoglutarate dehydrogenase complex dihydrolipoamide dehydrogenase (E3) component